MDLVLVNPDYNTKQIKYLTQNCLTFYFSGENINV